MKLGSKQIKEGLFKEVPLLPFNHMLDVWLCSNIDKVAEKFNARYGLLEGKEDGWLNYIPKDASGMVNDIDPASYVKLRGNRIVVILEKLERKIVVHEAYHVLSRVTKKKNAKTTGDGEEWAAYFMEYIVEQLLDVSNYEPIA